MLTLILATTASIAWGGASVFGGQAARSVSALTIAWWFSFMALPGIVVLALFATGPDAFSLSAFAIGMAAGAAAVVGATLLFLGFAKAPASSVVPLSGFMSALIPVTVASVFLDEDLSVFAIGGVALAIAAVWLVASDGARFDVRGLWYGLGSGVGFGIQFSIVGFIGDGSGLWPVVGVFLGASVVGAVVVFATGSPIRLGGSALWLTVGGSVCSVVANTTYLLAAQLGSLSTAAIIAALYAVPSVVLASVFLKERMLPRHWWGLGLAGAATAFISL